MCEKYGHTHSYGSFKRIVRKLAEVKPQKKKEKRKPKPYKRADKRLGCPSTEHHTGNDFCRVTQSAAGMDGVQKEALDKFGQALTKFLQSTLDHAQEKQNAVPEQ